MSEKKKIAIVLSGGGTKCAYAAGALLALADQYKFSNPDLVISESSGTISAMYYLSEQYEHMISGWLIAPTIPKFISMLQWPVVDVDVLVDIFLRKSYPLHEKKLRENRAELLIPLTRIDDGELVYHKLSGRDDPYEMIRASTAIPLLYGKTVALHGTMYIDGGFGSYPIDHVKEAVKQGATDIIFIRSTNGPNTATRQILQVASLFWKQNGDIGLARAAAREVKAEPDYLPPARVNLITLTSPKKEQWILGKNISELKRLIDRGYSDAVESSALKKLFS